MKDDRLISLNAAIEAIHNYWIAEMDKLPRKMVGEYEVLDGDYKTPLRHNKKICEAIEALPTVDAVPVVHGRWIPHEDEDGEHYGDKCSECGEWYVMPFRKTNFCPNCGAKMDGKEGGLDESDD